MRLGEAFPLARLLSGDIGTQERDGYKRLLVNRVTTAVCGRDITLSLFAILHVRPLEYLAVTPFCPEEGYRLDPADHDPVARVDKLRDTFWGHVDAPREMFPVSPYRLLIEVRHDLEPVADLHLELGFPEGSRYLAAPEPRHDEPHRCDYARWVPADDGPLACVPGIAPEWVSVNVPGSPELLATLSARLLHFPGRRTPGPENYVEED